MLITRNQKQILLAIFILSGFSGLIYQSIWSHYLGLFVGHAAYAQAIVLSIFMGGMAAGAAWIARVGSSWRNLIKKYAIIEGLIGVLGLAFHEIFINATDISYSTLIPALENPSLISVLRYFIASIIILPQTILLGMTFPLMSGGLIRRFPGQDGSLLGGLYFTNSIGAAFGALVSVFFLLPEMGLHGAIVTAGFINFVVAIVAWWLAKDPEPVSSIQTNAPPKPEQASLLRVVLIATSLSGAASFIYEIVWVRMLSLAVGTTMHAFELMLCSFIAGIGFGGLWVHKRADNTRSPLRMAGWMQIGMGLAALASLAVYANAFTWVGWMIAALTKTDSGYVLFNFGTAAIAVAIMLPAAFFAGTTLPLFTLELLRAGYGERSIGRVYAWNTLGSIFGVLAAIHILIPGIGLKLALCIGAIVDLCIGIFLLRIQVQSTRDMRQLSIVGGATAVVIILIVTEVPFDPMRLSSGVFRHGESSLEKNKEIVFYQDGKTASISVFGDRTEGTFFISTNGKVDAAIQLRDGARPSTDEHTMALLAGLPLAAHQRPSEVGVIGFGSGMTTHTLLADARVKRVDTIEIEPAIIKGANLFGKRVERAFNDPRSNIVIDDAKAYFSGHKKKYDLIISEPSNPWISGVGTLFSKEFYQFVPRHLKDDGLFVQWIQLYEIDDDLLASILKALTPAFEDYAAWIGSGGDLIILAKPLGKLPQPLDFGRILEGKLGEDLRRLGFQQPEQLAFRQVADARLLRTLAHTAAQPNSDYAPILSLNAPRTRFKKSGATTLMTIPYQPVLLLESLGIRKALPPQVTTPSDHTFETYEMTQQARALVAYLTNAHGAAQDFSSGGIRSGPALRASAAQSCAAPLTPRQTLVLTRQLIEVAWQTIDLLPPEQLQSLFHQPSWLPCLNQWPTQLQELLKLLDSMARRDWDGMLTHGAYWLAQPVNETVAEVRPLAISAAMLAHAHAQQWNQVLAADQKATQYIVNSSVGNAMVRRLLAGVARDGVAQ